MIWTGTEARDKWYWGPLFLPHEFADSQSGDLTIDTEFMDKLVLLRNDFRKPMQVSSGFRTPKHNNQVSTTGFDGPHTTGGACDIKIMGEDAYLLVKLAFKAGFSGIGVKQLGPDYSRFIHLDNLSLPTYPRPRCWSYA